MDYRTIITPDDFMAYVAALTNTIAPTYRGSLEEYLRAIWHHHRTRNDRTFAKGLHQQHDHQMSREFPNAF
jgi:hypothetical protein